jgi:hypothetical protein
MPLLNTSVWSERLREVLSLYAEPLLRTVAGKLFRPRNQWPAQQLIDRCLEALQNAVACDRRLRELDPACRLTLALIAHSRQPRWHVGNLVEMLVALGNADGLQPILTLLQTGLLYPDLAPIPPASANRNGSPSEPRLKNFEHWLTQGTTPVVFAHPQVAERALAETYRFPDCPGAVSIPSDQQLSPILESDGLEWPIRLALIWQMASAGPLRRTLAGDFFKRDLERLRGDPLLNAQPIDNLADIPDRGLLTVELALIEGLLSAQEGELRPGRMPEVWQEGLPETLASLWASLPLLTNWNTRQGWKLETSPGNPYASTYLLAFWLLTRLPDGSWAKPAALEQWLLEHHPYWHHGKPDAPALGLESFLLGVAFPLKLIQATRSEGSEVLIRLSPMGRWLLGLAEQPPAQPSFPQTLLVQPNLEILVYRQGLTPDLIGRLGKLASWKTLGAACTMDLSPSTVYRALEAGETFESILQTLQKHGMKAVPEAVIESLRTWSNRRERIAVYSSAALLEFLNAEDLASALARGLPAVRVGDRLAVVAESDRIDFRHYRLTGTRDYSLPPEKCVEIDDDGITLRIDLARSDLMVETEVQRFAALVDGAPVNGRRIYRMTPGSLQASRAGGLSLQALETWFYQRSGQEISAAAKLLWVGSDTPPVELRRLLVLVVPTPELADGLMQLRETRELIQERLGPTSLAVSDQVVDRLQRQLEAIGVEVKINS